MSGFVEMFARPKCFIVSVMSKRCEDTFRDVLPNYRLSRAWNGFAFVIRGDEAAVL